MTPKQQWVTKKFSHTVNVHRTFAKKHRESSISVKQFYSIYKTKISINNNK